MNINTTDLYAPRSPTWCPGCGNFGLWASLKASLAQTGWGPEQYALVYGVGCSGNMTDFIKTHGFHSLHGRAVPNAEGIKLANHDLNVICVVGDGDCYGEGGNHLIHAMRGNTDIVVIVHDNRVYGLTTGQAAPTAAKGYKAKSTPAGVIEYPVNALALGITQGASFVAQGFAGDIPHLNQVIGAALKHRGFALVNVLQPCVTFNKVVTYQFYRERVYKLADQGHNPKDMSSALQRVLRQDEKIPLGIIYQSNRPTYQDQVEVLKNGPLARLDISKASDMSDLFGKYTEG